VKINRNLEKWKKTYKTHTIEEACGAVSLNLTKKCNSGGVCSSCLACYWDLTELPMGS